MGSLRKDQIKIAGYISCAKFHFVLECLTLNKFLVEDVLVLVIGGISDEAQNTSELVDLSGKNRNCWQSSIHNTFGMSGSALDGTVVTCGGFVTFNGSPSTGSEKCYSYHKEAHSWTHFATMDEHVRYMSAIPYDQDHIWFVGGKKDGAIGLTSSTFLLEYQKQGDSCSH